MKELTYGLIKGRHDLPCENYLFKKVENVHDYNSIAMHISNILSNTLTWSMTTDMNNYPIYQSEQDLIVYVTGLTPVTVELVKYCMNHHVPLTLMNYDNQTGDYVPQQVVNRL